MIGQVKLKDAFKYLNLDNLNHSNLFIGPKNCGKHTFIKYLGESFNQEILDITDSISVDLISDLMLSPSINFRLIDLNELSIKEQNSILKLVEEPAANLYLFLIADSENIPLPTIKNRCIIYIFERYTKSDLKVFSTDEYLLSIFNTPGDLILANTEDINSIKMLVNNFIDNANKANYSNLLTITNKMSFDDSVKGYNYYVFMKVLIYELKQRFKAGENSAFTKYYLTTNALKDLDIYNINKKNVFEKFIINFKEL